MCGGIADAGVWGTERGATSVVPVGAAWATLEPNSASVFCCMSDSLEIFFVDID
jgi:hypothetical protein